MSQALITQLTTQLTPSLRAANVKLGYLFGSVAKVQATPESDLDLALLFDYQTTADQRFEHRLKLATQFETLLERRVDLVVINDTPSILLRYVIICEGLPFYCAANFSRAAYEAQVMGEYFDFEPFIVEYNRRYVANNV